MLFVQTGLGVEILSPIAILILVMGVAFIVGVSVAMINIEGETKTMKTSCLSLFLSFSSSSRGNS